MRCLDFMGWENLPQEGSTMVDNRVQGYALSS